MALNLVTLRNSVINYLNKNNTSTSSNDLSSGLHGRIKTIKKGKADRTAIPNNLYPAILCRVSSVNEELAQLGNGATRTHRINIILEAMTMYGMAVSEEASADENYTLSQNITSLLRQDMTMSNTVSMIDNVEVLFDEVVQGDSFANYVATINIFTEKITK